MSEAGQWEPGNWPDVHAACGKGSAQAAQVQQVQRAGSPREPTCHIWPNASPEPLESLLPAWHGSKHQNAECVSRAPQVPSSLHWPGSQHQNAECVSAGITSALAILGTALP